ncbi:MAG: glycosyltransferase family 61 protein [Proteobacteria bacterium]|nr:glycosyltransferase family 61 protein [Pseudomonadota bacterium]
MAKNWEPILGVKWFRDIVADTHRQYGVEVHEHLPEETVNMERLGYDSAIRRPQETRMLRDLAEYFGEWPTKLVFPEAYAATIENGMVIGNSGMVITPDGYLIAETGSLIGINDGRCLTIEHIKKNINLPYKGHFKGNLLSMANPSGGYGHHLWESFFPMFWFDGMNFNYVNVAEGRNYDRMVEFFEPIGFPKEYLLAIKQGEFLTADKVSFYGPRSYYFQRRPKNIQMIEDRFVGPRRSKLPATKKIFRIVGEKTHGATRAMGVQETIMLFLKEQGFECIDPATLNLTEKIDIFSQARFIINPDDNAFVFSDNNVKLGRILSPHIGLLIKVSGTGFNYHPGLTNSPPSVIYPDFCKDKGYFLSTDGSLGKMTVLSFFPQICRVHGEIMTKTPEYYVDKYLASTIDLEKFKEFYKLLDEA